MARFRGCEVCKQQIDAERAEALPRTRLCTKHARQLERRDKRGELIRVVSEESTTKQGSLKKTGGAGIFVDFVRNVEAIAKLRETFETKRALVS